MKAALEIRKLIWPINSVLLAIIVYLTVNFIFSEKTIKSTSAYQIPMLEKVEIIPVKNLLPSDNHKIITERNIFSSCELKEFKENAQREQNIDPLSIIKEQFRLLATVSGDDQLACAVIENMKSRAQDIYKAGDKIEGVSIEKIDRNQVVLCCGEKRELLNLQTICEASDTAAINKKPVAAQTQKTTTKDIFKKTSNTELQGIEAFLENIETAPYVINDEEKGLCISGLDDINIAGCFGFEDGDIIQSLNGQMLTNKQKAFQVLKKARSQSSLNFQLLRNQQKIDLTFQI